PPRTSHRGDDARDDVDERRSGPQAGAHAHSLTPRPEGRERNDEERDEAAPPWPPTEEAERDGHVDGEEHREREHDEADDDDVLHEVSPIVAIKAPCRPALGRPIRRRRRAVSRRKAPSRRTSPRRGLRHGGGKRRWASSLRRAAASRLPEGEGLRPRSPSQRRTPRTTDRRPGCLDRSVPPRPPCSPPCLG